MKSDIDGLENQVRDMMVRQLRRNLAKCRKVLVNENLDLKTRERWTQLYNNTSTVLNQILKDRQMRDWEKRLREIEEWEERNENGATPDTRTESKPTEQSRPASKEA